MLLALLLTSALEFGAGGLEQRIEFWKSVFTEYGEDHLIFHDRNHVHLIYDVLDLRAAGLDRKARAAEQQVAARHRQFLSEAVAGISLTSPEYWSDLTRTVATRIEERGIRDQPLDLAERIHIQRGVRERFSDGLKRYSTMGHIVERILREEGISEHFAALPLVESSYLNTALSRTGAAGIWQFMPSTARQFMKVNSKVDQRLDLVIATRSAARLLLKNFSILRNWPLAISAYNHGLAGMQRAKEQCGEVLSELLECYDGPSFGYASMNFYSEFLAALDLLNEHRRKLPIAVVKNDATPRSTPTQQYRVRKGDTLLRIAKKFATTQQQLMDLNKINNANRLIAGRFIRVPRG